MSLSFYPVSLRRDGSRSVCNRVQVISNSNSFNLSVLPGNRMVKVVLISLFAHYEHAILCPYLMRQELLPSIELA